MIEIKINKHLYKRDPEETVLGKKFLNKSIELIAKLGFEDFTLKKLAIEAESTEASVYRYFENKHKLLIYLVSWYWAWQEYQILFMNQNTADPLLKLKNTIAVLCAENKNDPNFSHINEQLLSKIVILEASKTYFTIHVDDINKDGAYIAYKSLCALIASIILEIKPNYNYSRALSSTLLEGIHHHIFYSLHLPSLTDFDKEQKDYQEIGLFYEKLILNQILTK